MIRDGLINKMDKLYTTYKVLTSSKLTVIQNGI